MSIGYYRAVMAMRGWADLGLSRLDKEILLRLADHADETGTSWPGRKCLAGECECTERAVKLSLRALEKVGRIRFRQSHGRGHLSCVELCFAPIEKGASVFPFLDTADAEKGNKPVKKGEQTGQHIYIESSLIENKRASAPPPRPPDLLGDTPETTPPPRAASKTAKEHVSPPVLQVAEALSEVTGIVLDKLNKGNLCKQAKDILTVGATAADVRRIYGPDGAWRGSDHWQARKGESPSIKSIRETISWFLNTSDPSPALASVMSARIPDDDLPKGW